jgi:hypothetical protein
MACRGLVGLVAYSAEQRIKEIGIRKVLGASTMNVIGFLSKDFLKLIIIAIIIASPLAFWTSHRWLQDFAYRRTLNPWFFVIAALVTITITWLTIFFRSVKVASQIHQQFSGMNNSSNGQPFLITVLSSDEVCFFISQIISSNLSFLLPIIIRRWLVIMHHP